MQNEISPSLIIPHNPGEWVDYLNLVFRDDEITIDQLIDESYKFVLAKRMGVKSVIHHLEILHAKQLSKNKEP